MSAPRVHYVPAWVAFRGVTVCGRAYTDTLRGTAHFGSVTCTRCNGRSNAGRKPAYS